MNPEIAIDWIAGPPILEPGPLPLALELQFPQKIKDYWDAVGDHRCQTHLYSEARGWYICGSTVKIETDHLIPESVALEMGLDPNNDVVGMPRCWQHHQGPGMVYEHGIARLALYGEPQWSRHPDFYRARQAYRKGDKDAFKKAAHEHHVRALRGQNIANSTFDIDQYEIEWMLALEQRYRESTGRTRPHVKPHRGYDPTRKGRL